MAYKRITGNFCIIDVVPKSVAGKILCVPFSLHKGRD